MWSFAFFAPLKSGALLQQSLPYIGKLSTRKTPQPRLFPMWSFAFFAPLKSGALLQQSLPYIGKLSTRKAYQLRLFPTRSLVFFVPSESGALLQQSLPYIGKLSTRKAYHERLPSFTCFPCGALPFFAPLNIESFALTLPWQSLLIAKLSLQSLPTQIFLW